MKNYYLFAFFLIISQSALHATIYSVENTNDDGINSLRWAIEQANANPGPDEIHFNIPGSGPHEIIPLTPLPFVTDPCIIDAYTQAGAIPATAGSTAVIKVGLNGTMVDPEIEGYHGFALSSNCTVRGFAIFNFGSAVNVATDNNVVEGCYIGLDISGTIPMGNVFDGIFITGQSNRIGGPAPAQRNVISGNSYGVAIFPHSTNNVIQGNYVGTDANGTTTLSNDNEGIGSGGSNNQILDNLVVGHASANIAVVHWSEFDPVPTGNLIAGNRIGHHADGSLTNAVNCQGVMLFGGANTVIRDNIIYGNDCHGVLITEDESTGNLITNNAIYNNGDISINLDFDGVTPNDPGDQDSGPNDLLNYPVLEEARLTTGGTLVKGYIDTPDPKSIRIEFYSISTPHPSGHGGGAVFLGSGTPNSGGKIKEVLPMVADGDYITAIAIDSENNTSEFAGNIPAENVISGPGNSLSVKSSGFSGIVEGPSIKVFPNPTSGRSTFRYYQPKDSHIRLLIKDLSGRTIRVLADRFQEAGIHQIRFDGADLPAGLYTYHLMDRGRTLSGKMMLQTR